MSDKLDAGIYLAAVLTHIANHVMDEGDAQAWRLVSDRQKEFFSELSQEERDEGHRVIREPKGEALSEPPCDEATIWVIRPRWIRLRP
jgi:hypothetical protein